MNTTTHHFTVPFGDKAHRHLSAKRPFSVDGVAAQEIEAGVWAFEVRPDQYWFSVTFLDNDGDSGAGSALGDLVVDFDQLDQQTLAKTTL